MKICLGETVDDRNVQVHDKCMAVKTMTIDLEAYGALTRRKRKGQSFSQVIKEHFANRCTGRDLALVLEDLEVSETTLDAVEEQISARSTDTARPVDL
ncbi:MAG: antitoxin VapB family protein [Thermoanaerobaculia bacterium]|nr:antitoxin VapB family protein [Thermoanaerobaculia bacterium]